MILKPEQRRALFGFIGANPLKNTHAVVQGMGQHMRFCLAPGHKLAIRQISPSLSSIFIVVIARV